MMKITTLILLLSAVSGQDPTVSPVPSSVPSGGPTIITEAPSFVPSGAPSTLSPSDAPSIEPSLEPSSTPSVDTSVSPTDSSSNAPSLAPSVTPTTVPSETPTETPSIAPSTESPSLAPTDTLQSPSASPSEPDASASPSATASNAPTLVDSLAPTLTASVSATLVASISPTTSVAPSTVNASSSPSLLDSNAPSIRDSTSPSALDSSSPSTEPSALASQNPTIATTFDCIDDPAFTQLGPDDNGNATDCSWFEFYVFNSCQDFGDWNDPDGNTANEGCCVCGGGILLLPSSEPTVAPSSMEPTLMMVETTAPTGTLCGCDSCTESIWNTPTAGAVTCGDRINFLQSVEGGSLSETDACHTIAHDEYYLQCAPCDALYCNDQEDHSHCGCETCTDEIWRRDAAGVTCGQRMDFLQDQNLGMMEACQQIGQSEFPNECGACNPSTCGMPSNSNRRNSFSWMVGSSILLLLPLITV